MWSSFHKMCVSGWEVFHVLLLWGSWLVPVSCAGRPFRWCWWPTRWIWSTWEKSPVNRARRWLQNIVWVHNCLFCMLSGCNAFWVWRLQWFGTTGESMQGALGQNKAIKSFSYWQNKTNQCKKKQTQKNTPASRLIFDNCTSNISALCIQKLRGKNPCVITHQRQYLMRNNALLFGKKSKILPSMGWSAAQCFSSPSGREQ